MSLKALGIRNGHESLMVLEDRCARPQTVDTALERVRVIARGRRMDATSVVDDFIAERRAEAAKERSMPRAAEPRHGPVPGR